MEKEQPIFAELISNMNDYYQDLLGYSVKETNLLIKEGSNGLYLPRNKTAIISKEDKLGLFHEYFGHGLYCEQSLVGREIVNLEKKLLEEEKEFFGTKKFSFEELEKFRKQNKAFLELQEFRDKNLGWFEGFAIFSEYFLSKNFDSTDNFEKKYNSLPKEDKECFGKIIDFNKDYGNLATFYSFGLAKKTTPERVKKLLEETFKDKLKDVRLAVLYGSKKEFSDIDVLIVSDDFQETDSSWLDIRVENTKDFEKMIKFLDASLIGPILDSNYILGDKNYFDTKKKQLSEQPITQRAIDYNIKKSKEQKKLALKCPEDSSKRRHGLKYVNSYLKQVINLEQKHNFLNNSKGMIE